MTYIICQDVRTKFHENRFRHLSNIPVIAVTLWDAVMFVSLIGGIHGVSCWDGFMHNKAFKQYSVFASDIWEAVMLVLLIEGTYGVRLWDSFKWCNIHPSFTKTNAGVQPILHVLPQKCERLWCSYWWWEEFEMGLGSMIYVISFIKIVSGVQKLIKAIHVQAYTDTETGR
jgi:hypothetical protein